MLTLVASTSDSQTALGLQALRESGSEPMTYAKLRSLGVMRPAAVIYELELAGHLISRRPEGLRLGEPEAEAKPPPPPRPRVRVRQRDDPGTADGP